MRWLTVRLEGTGFTREIARRAVYAEFKRWISIPKPWMYSQDIRDYVEVQQAERWTVIVELEVIAR
jgi:hypothetical protein